MVPYIKSLRLKGFKAFKDTTFEFSPLEVIVGANGCGKTSLFEFLRFLRDSMEYDIPSEIIKGTIGQRIFNDEENKKFSWELSYLNPDILVYGGELTGPIGAPKINNEYIEYKGKKEFYKTALPRKRLNITLKKYFMEYSKYNDLLFEVLFTTSRFYSSFTINKTLTRNPAIVEQRSLLYEDASNLSSVLFNILTDYPDAFGELEFHLKSIVPGFRGIKVKAYGAPGQVMAFWQEESVNDLTLADLSDGILNILCWVALCVHPSPPPLICIDEPDIGIHPRALAVLASLFEKASERTQIILTTHSSYFLSMFPLENIAVMRKKKGNIEYAKPKDSKALAGILEEFGKDEIESLHKSDELEHFA